MTKYLLLCGNPELYCKAYDTYGEAYKTMETEFEKAKKGIREEYNSRPTWFMNGCFVNGAVLETLDEKYMLKWKIVKLTEEGQITEIKYPDEQSKSREKEKKVTKKRKREYR